MKKLLITITGLVLLFPGKALAQVATAPAIGTVDKTKLGVLSLNDIIRNGVMIALGVGGLIFFFMLIFGGIKYLTSGGDEKAVTAARATLTNAFIGLVIIVASFLIASLIFNLFGLKGIGIS